LNGVTRKVKVTKNLVDSFLDCVQPFHEISYIVISSFRVILLTDRQTNGE